MDNSIFNARDRSQPTERIRVTRSVFLFLAFPFSSSLPFQGCFSLFFSPLFWGEFHGQGRAGYYFKSHTHTLEIAKGRRRLCDQKQATIFDKIPSGYNTESHVTLARRKGKEGSHGGWPGGFFSYYPARIELSGLPCQQKYELDQSSASECLLVVCNNADLRLPSSGFSLGDFFLTSCLWESRLLWGKGIVD